MMRQNRMSQRSSANAPLTRGQLLALVLVFIVTAFALLALDQRNLLGPLKATAERPIFALSERFTSFGDGLRKFGARFGNVGELRDENVTTEALLETIAAAAVVETSHDE